MGIKQGDYITCPALKEGAYKVIETGFNLLIDVDGIEVRVPNSWCTKTERPLQKEDEVWVRGIYQRKDEDGWHAVLIEGDEVLCTEVKRDE